VTGVRTAAARAQEAVFQLLRLAGLLDALPLPPGSAQAEMVAAGLSQRATLPEREARRPAKHPWIENGGKKSALACVQLAGRCCA
jgi:hypothetical protein